MVRREEGPVLTIKRIASPFQIARKSPLWTKSAYSLIPLKNVGDVVNRTRTDKALLFVRSFLVSDWHSGARIKLPQIPFLNKHRPDSGKIGFACPRGEHTPVALSARKGSQGKFLFCNFSGCDFGIVLA